MEDAGRLCVHRLDDAVAQVVDEDEIPGLTPIAIDGDGLAGQDLAKQMGDDAAFARRVGSVDVGKSQHGRRQTV